MRAAKTYASNVRALCASLLAAFHHGDFHTMTAMLGLPATEKLRAILCAAHTSVLKEKDMADPGLGPGGSSAGGNKAALDAHAAAVAKFKSVQGALQLRRIITSVGVPVPAA